MKTLKGNLINLALDGYFDVIVHGCNCQCEMGAGIAKAIKENFPEAYKADLQTAKSDPHKLGTISYAEVRRGKTDFIVVNGYTQFDWKGPGVLLDYDALEKVMLEIKQIFSGKKIAYPKIGAGLAGGDWNKIAVIIDKILDTEDHTLVELN